MENHRSTSTTDRSGRPRVVPWEPFEDHAAVVFGVAGASLLASLFAPVGLSALTHRPWLAGIALVGLAVVAAAVGLLGLYPRVSDRSPGLASVGATAAVVAGAAGTVLLALGGVTVAAIALPGVEFSVTMRWFATLSLAMAGGYALGFLSFGVAGLRSGGLPGRSGHLLAGGGVLLLLPVVLGLLEVALGTGLPPWLLFPILGLVAVDTLAVGLSLRSSPRAAERSAP